jgi:hypothetical protein
LYKQPSGIVTALHKGVKELNISEPLLQTDVKMILHRPVKETDISGTELNRVLRTLNI